MTYLAAMVTGAAQYRARQQVEHLFEGMAWLAQILLFVMLGLLVTPHELPPYLVGAVIGAAVLILLARRVAVFACLLPFGFTLRETAFASWVRLRGAVPIYLSIVPALADPRRDQRLFASIFILVIASLVVAAEAAAFVLVQRFRIHCIDGSSRGIDSILPSVDHRVAVEIIDELDDALFELVF